MIFKALSIFSFCLLTFSIFSILSPFTLHEEEVSFRAQSAKSSLFLNDENAECHLNLPIQTPPYSGLDSCTAQSSGASLPLVCLFYIPLSRMMVRLKLLRHGCPDTPKQQHSMLTLLGTSAPVPVQSRP